MLVQMAASIQSVLHSPFLSKHKIRLIMLCDAMMHVLKDFINLKYSELLTKEISKSN